jgi:hypothetical protein
MARNSIKPRINNSAYRALGNLGMVFISAMCELLDNAFKAIKGDTMKIAIYCEKLLLLNDNGTEKEPVYRFYVADTGAGMTKGKLEDMISFGVPDKELNENGCPKANATGNTQFGFGFKNAIAAFVNGMDVETWSIATRSSAKRPYMVYSGPFTSKAKNLTHGFSIPQGLLDALDGEEPSTIISFDTSWSFLQTITKVSLHDAVRTVDEDDFKRSLYEHLAFIYAGYLCKETIDHRKVYSLRIADYPVDGSHGCVEVVPYAAPYESKTISTVRTQVRDAADKRPRYVDVEVIHGSLNLEKRNDFLVNKVGYSADKVDDMAIYFRNNQNTSGLAITYNGRVIGRSMLSEVFGLQRHPIFNDLIGEIVIPQSVSPMTFPTQMNKEGVNASCANWDTLFRAIRSSIKNLRNSSVSAQFEQQVMDDMQQLSAGNMVSPVAFFDGTFKETCPFATKSEDGGAIIGISSMTKKLNPKIWQEIYIKWCYLVSTNQHPEKIVVYTPDANAKSSCEAAINAALAAMPAPYDYELNKPVPCTGNVSITYIQ